MTDVTIQKICAVEIQGSEAILCLLSMDRELMSVHDCRTARLPLHSSDTDKVRYFQSTFKKLMEDYQVATVVIKERPKKGKFAGGADGFKIETAIQLIDSLQVELITAQAINEQLKHTPLMMDAKDLGLKKFQDVALQTGFAWLNKNT